VLRGPLVEHPPDQTYHRHIVDEMFGEQFLARIGFEMGKALAGIRQHQIAFAQLGEPQQLQGFAEVKDLVGFELQVAARTGRSACPL